MYIVNKEMTTVYSVITMFTILSQSVYAYKGCDKDESVKKVYVK